MVDSTKIEIADRVLAKLADLKDNERRLSDRVQRATQELDDVRRQIGFIEGMVVRASAPIINIDSVIYSPPDIQHRVRVSECQAHRAERERNLSAAAEAAVPLGEQIDTADDLKLRSIERSTRNRQILRAREFAAMRADEEAAALEFASRRASREDVELKVSLLRELLKAAGPQTLDRLHARLVSRLGGKAGSSINLMDLMRKRPDVFARTDRATWGLAENSEGKA